MAERADGSSNKPGGNLDDARRVTSPPTKRPSARRDDTKEAQPPAWMRPLSYHKARTKVVGS